MRKSDGVAERQSSKHRYDRDDDPEDDLLPDVEGDGVFHYEHGHESLEDEIFELHTPEKPEETDP